MPSGLSRSEGLYGGAATSRLHVPARTTAGLVQESHNESDKNFFLKKIKKGLPEKLENQMLTCAERAQRLNQRDAIIGSPRTRARGLVTCPGL